MPKTSVTEITENLGYRLVYATTGGLEHLVSKRGGLLKGLTIRGADEDCLLVLRADFEGKSMVAFIGAATGAHALCQAEKKLRTGTLKWRKDKYRNG